MDAVGHAPLRQRPAAASDGNRAWSKSGEISSSENWKCVQRHLMVLAWHQVTPTMDGNDSRMGPFRYLVWLLPLSLHALCRAQRITIRLIDVRNRCPPPNRQVSLSLLCDKGESTPAKYDAALHSKTDSSGPAESRLPEPEPAHLSAWADLTTWEHWRSVCSILVATHDVIQKGYVAPQPGPWAQKSQVPLRRFREVLFLARPQNLH